MYKPARADKVGDAAGVKFLTNDGTRQSWSTKWKLGIEVHINPAFVFIPTSPLSTLEQHQHKRKR